MFAAVALLLVIGGPQAPWVAADLQYLGVDAVAGTVSDLGTTPAEYVVITAPGDCVISTPCSPADRQGLLDEAGLLVSMARLVGVRPVFTLYPEHGPWSAVGKPEYDKIADNYRSTLSRRGVLLVKTASADGVMRAINRSRRRPPVHGGLLPWGFKKLPD